MLELGTRMLKTESELVLKSRRVTPRRLLEAGFRFEFPEWPAAVKELVSR
jgi:NAD dependent epimerase/dehydratase family enzyme